MLHTQLTINRAPRRQRREEVRYSQIVNVHSRLIRRRVRGGDHQYGIVIPIVEPPAPQWIGGFDFAGLDGGLVVYEAGPLTPEEDNTWAATFTQEASVTKFLVKTQINGKPWSNMKVFAPINVMNGDSIQFTYTLHLAGDPH